MLESFKIVKGETVMPTSLFLGAKVYYSGSIRGIPETDPGLPWKLVQYMLENGADVLSAHVAGRTAEERESIRQLRMPGTDLTKEPEPWVITREQDIAWVDEATHVVALVNGASHGVGMEIQRALDKPLLGLNFTPVLCLIREDLSGNVTWMIKGIRQEGFSLEAYSTLEDAFEHIRNFLLA